MAHNQRFSEDSLSIVTHFDPDSTALTTGLSSGWVDMKGWRNVAFIAVRKTNAGGSVQSGQVYVSASSTGSAAQAVGSAATSAVATGEFSGIGGLVSNQGAGLYIIEANHDECAAALGTGRYVAPYFQCETGTDEFVLITVLSDPEHSQASLTKARTSAEAI